LTKYGASGLRKSDSIPLSQFGATAEKSLYPVL
jgi:hypothetical protein